MVSDHSSVSESVTASIAMTSLLASSLLSAACWMFPRGDATGFCSYKEKQGSAYITSFQSFTTNSILRLICVGLVQRIHVCMEIGTERITITSATKYFDTKFIMFSKQYFTAHFHFTVSYHPDWTVQGSILFCIINRTLTVFKQRASLNTRSLV